MPNDKIKKIKAKEILDSRGFPTVEVELFTPAGFFKASVPSGVSTGKYEAMEIRDNGKKSNGRGVKKAIKNIEEKIFPRIKNKSVSNLGEIDRILIDLDGTENKSKLGVNAILPVSLAICRAGASASGLPLWEYISKLAEIWSPVIMPSPMFLAVEGGRHAKNLKNKIDFQEFLIIIEASSFKEKLQAGKEIYEHLGFLLEREYGEEAAKTGYEGGFNPEMEIEAEIIAFILKAAQEKGYAKQIKIGLDAAASSFYKNKLYYLEGGYFKRENLLEFYAEICAKYPVISVEDPFCEEDWLGFQMIVQNLGGRVTIVGDDLTATNIKRMEEAKNKNACSGVIIKPNQIGTVSETIAAAKLAKKYGWKIIVSHRAGETGDDFIADLAVGVRADFIKSGAPFPKERMAKYNRLVEIEKEITQHSGNLLKETQ